MLILSRKLLEQIQIGTDITITVTAIEGGRVKLGITAPREVRVDRMEVREQREHDRGPPLARFGQRKLAGAGVRKRVA